jgi:hypothetical protein
MNRLKTTLALATAAAPATLLLGATGTAHADPLDGIRDAATSVRSKSGCAPLHYKVELEAAAGLVVTDKVKAPGGCGRRMSMATRVYRHGSWVPVIPRARRFRESTGSCQVGPPAPSVTADTPITAWASSAPRTLMAVAYPWTTCPSCSGNQRNPSPSPHRLPASFPAAPFAAARSHPRFPSPPAPQNQSSHHNHPPALHHRRHQQQR